MRRLHADTNAAIDAGRAQAVVLAEDEAGRLWKVLRPAAMCEVNEAPCAVVWRVGRKVVKVRLVDSSPSGDWYTAVEYYFRGDGRVAFRFEEHVTYYCASPESDAVGGPCRIERRQWRDEAGKVRREREARFMTVKGKEQSLDARASIQEPPALPHYARLAELPFARQLQSAP